MMGRHLKCSVLFFLHLSSFYKSDGSWRLALLIQTQKGQISAPHLRCQKLSEQLNTFNLILRSWKNQYETTSEMNGEFGNPDIGANIRIVGKDYISF